MKNKLTLFSVFFVLLFAVFTSAAIVSHPSSGEATSESNSFKVEFDTIKGSLYLGEKAEFQITITNNLINSSDYDLDFANTGEWLPIRTDPIYHGLTGMEVSGTSSDTTTVIIKPRDTTGVGSYIIESVITSGDEKVSVLLPVTILSTSELTGVYVPDIKATVQISEEVDPREPVELLVVLKNNNFRNITNLTINIESELLGKKTIVETLDPNEAKTVKVPFPVDPLQKPTTDTIYTIVYADDTQFTPAAKTFRIVDYTDELTKNIIEKDTFLKDKKIITFTNDGNVRKGEQYKLEKTWFQRLFTFSSEDPQLFEQDEKKYISWYVELDPTESKQIITSTNFRPLFYVILFIIIAVLLHFLFKSPLIVEKKFTNVSVDEGGISEIKVLINIKNSSDKRIKDVEVIDRIPHIADIKQNFDVGTLKPNKILKHRKKGTIVKWKLEDVEGSEERIIKYEIKSKLSILGNFRLLPTVVKYKTPKGREVVVRSNSLVVPKTSD